MPSAPLLFGDTSLNTTYGLVEKVGPRLKLWFSPDFIWLVSPGSDPTGGNASNSIDAAAVLVCSCCWAVA